jgi:2-oxoglutarate dehydrogenase E2 component (dihydrolipoamide succinyltransferase)
MPVVDLVMPKLGESIVEATILKWHKKSGDTVKQDETVLDIATDKVDSEVPSTAEGVVEEVLYKENDVVPIGAVIARINTNGSANGTAKNGAATVTQTAPAPAPQPEPEIEETSDYIPFQPAAIAPEAKPNAGGIRFYSPLVLKIAQEEGISMVDLEKIPGTGQDGRVSKKDILEFVANKKTTPTNGQQKPEAKAEVINQQPETVVKNTPAQQPAETNQSLPAVQSSSVVSSPSPANYGGNVEIIEMDRMRKMIAKHMVDSKHTSPHVTSFTEADVTNMVLWREKTKKDFEKREGTKITFTPLFIEAIIKCIKKFPLINSSLDGDRIILKKDINIGMATALPSGNLIVPVIKNADGLNLVGLSKQVNNLADAARNGKLRPDDTQGGTFTMTNVGTFGSLMGTPIINQPQVAILAVGAIKKRPVVIETAQGDSIAIRHMMYLSMSYDHRIVDGSLGATFLTAVAKELENWDINRTI